jgi:hypothetical protein
MTVLPEQLEFNLPSPESNIANITPEPFVISNKNQIKWPASPFKQPNISLYDLEDMTYPSEMPSVLDYFTEYLDDTDFSNMAYFTNLYSVQKQQSRFKPTDSSEMKRFIGIHIIMGCVKYPRNRMYWENFYQVKLVRDSMARNRFFFFITIKFPFN